MSLLPLHEFLKYFLAPGDTSIPAAVDVEHLGGVSES